jgi:hypothetical protein
MPPTVGKSGLFAKLGDRLKQAHEQHKNDETTFSNFSDLPAGIEGGIAKLSDCRFSQYKEGDNKGQYFFMARAIVVHPKRFVDKDGIEHDVQGKATQIGPEPLCDTPTRTRKTVADHVAWVLNELRKLGVDTRQLTSDQYEAAAAAIKAQGPGVKFRTWKGQAQTSGPYAGQEPRTQHQWDGTCELPVDSGEVVGVDDETETQTADPSTNGTYEDPSNADGAYDEPATTTDEGPDLDAIAAKATANDKAACQELIDIAVAAGIPKKTAEDADTWPELVAMIREAQGGGEAADEVVEETEEVVEEVEEPKPFVPAVGLTCKYHPVDKETKKPQKKAVPVEIVEVDKRAKKVTIKDSDNPRRQWKGVRFDALVPNKD